MKLTKKSKLGKPVSQKIMDDANEFFEQGGNYLSDGVYADWDFFLSMHYGIHWVPWMKEYRLNLKEEEQDFLYTELEKIELAKEKKSKKV